MALATPMPAPPVPSTGRSSVSTTMRDDRPTKRRRLAVQATVEITTREMDDMATSLEVDHMILDYVIYQGLRCCLTNPYTGWDEQVSPVECTLLQVDEFYALFRQRYPKYKLDAQLQLRRDLLQFAALFTQRLRRNTTTPSRESLKRVRNTNRLRAVRWIGEVSRRPTGAFDCDELDTQFPIGEAGIESSRAHVLQQLGVPPEDDAYEDAFYGTGESASFLDLLPFFMKVSAACFDIFDVGLSAQWISMATDLMVQAALEQYLVYGQDGSDAIDEAFAWGYQIPKDKEEHDFNELDSDVDKDSKIINSMFDQDHEGDDEAMNWQIAKDAALKTIFSCGETPLAEHFRGLQNAHAITTCERNVMAFLKDMSLGITKPVLLQLEEGCLDGMTVEETQSFIRDCGLDVASFLNRDV